MPREIIVQHPFPLSGIHGHDAGEIRRPATEVVMLHRGRIGTFSGTEVLPIAGDRCY